MAETRVITELTPALWDAKFSEEYYQQNPLAPYMGTSANSVIRIKEDFASAQGNGVTFEFITQLASRNALKNRERLRGNEQKLGEYGDKIFWTMRKQGISMHELDTDLAAIDLRKAAKSNLKDWADNDTKFEAIDRLLDVGATCDVPYSTATAAEKNTWTVNNSDRTLYGNAKSNYNATHATALLNVDSTNDKFVSSSVSLMKRIALTARPKITPISVEGAAKRYFVAFAHPFAFRDFKTSMASVNGTVFIKEKNMLIYQGGDEEYDGVIVHEMDDATLLTGVGAGSIDVAPVHFMGQEALGYAIKERYKTRTQEDDYQQVEGIAMIGKWGMKKLCYRYGSDSTIVGKQRGVVTGFFSAVSD